MSQNKPILVSVNGSYAIWACHTCQNLHRLPIDEELELWPCEGDPKSECTNVVCESCGGDDDDKCSCCGLRACGEHMRHKVVDSGGMWTHRCDLCRIANEQTEQEPEGIQCSSCSRYSSEVPGEGRYWSEHDSNTGHYDSGWMCQECVDCKPPEAAAVVGVAMESEDCPW